jgi:lysophospholipase L1-like esterase
VDVTRLDSGTSDRTMPPRDALSLPDTAVDSFLEIGPPTDSMVPPDTSETVDTALGMDTLGGMDTAVVPDTTEVPDTTITADTTATDTTRPADVVADTAPPGPFPAAMVNRVHLHLNLGDSVGEGYNASPRSERGFGPLVYRNHEAYPAWAGHDLVSRSPTARYVNRAHSGWTTANVASDLRDALRDLPRGGDGDDTVVTVSAGGNDFNDDLATILNPGTTDAVAARVAMNITEVLRNLRGRYHDPARGRVLVVLWNNVHDSTDDTGRVPPMFRDGFCRTIQNPLFLDFLRRTALDNLARFNARLTEAVRANGGFVVDSYRVFQGHGMNSPDRWIDNDCVHLTNTGHHELRREVWRTFTGERY